MPNQVDNALLRPGKNLGCALGVNDGIRHFLATRPGVAEILVCTHEMRFAPGVIDRLLEVARDRPRGHVVAPGSSREARTEQHRWSGRRVAA